MLKISSTGMLFRYMPEEFTEAVACPKSAL